MNTKNLNDSLTLVKKDNQVNLPVSNNNNNNKKYNKKHRLRIKDIKSHHNNNNNHHHHHQNNINSQNKSSDDQNCKEANFQSKIETAILNSHEPIDICETSEVCANGFKGIWANKTEIANWIGPLPLNEYPLNQDNNPILIKKKSNKRLEYEKKVFVKYLEPPAIPPPGEIIVNQEANKMAPEAPPIVIRQRPTRKKTPEPIIIREAPPPPPPVVPPKIITIPGKTIRRPREIIFEYDCQPPTACQQCKPALQAASKLCQDANCFSKFYKTQQSQAAQQQQQQQQQPPPSNFYPAPYPLQFSSSSSNLPPFYPQAGGYPALGFGPATNNFRNNFYPSFNNYRY